jgi:acyl-coenzyme A thioesterase PaaI-like protein
MQLDATGVAGQADSDEQAVLAFTAGTRPGISRAPVTDAAFGVPQATELLEQRMAPWLQELRLTVAACSPAGATLNLPGAARLLRPGNIICGPALMAAADTAMAIAILGRFGGLRNVATVSLSVDFMRPISMAGATLEAVVRHHGPSLIFAECIFVDKRRSFTAARATATWAIIDRCARHVHRSNSRSTNSV